MVKATVFLLNRIKNQVKASSVERRASSVERLEGKTEGKAMIVFSLAVVFSVLFSVLSLRHPLFAILI
jgi:hypothetical protein